MRQSQNEVLHLIDEQIERLKNAAEAEAVELRRTQQAAAEARIAYRASPTDVTERPMWKASMTADMQLENVRSADEAVQIGLAAREFIIAAFGEEEREKGRGRIA